MVSDLEYVHNMALGDFRGVELRSMLESLDAQYCDLDLTIKYKKKKDKKKNKDLSNYGLEMIN